MGVFQASASEARSRYALVFSLVAELSNLVNGEKPDTKFEVIKVVTDDLFKDGCLNDYLYENLKNLYNLYPELLPGRVSEDYQKDEKKEQEKINGINNLLMIMIQDLNNEIKDRAEQIAERQVLDQNGFDD